MDRSELSTRVDTIVRRVQAIRSSLCGARQRERKLCDDISEEEARIDDLTREIDSLNDDLQRALEDEASSYDNYDDYDDDDEDEDDDDD
jgi:chromosome segregation ATPase